MKMKYEGFSIIKLLSWLVSWLVGCGFTSHSAIFQLYSDGTDAQFPNFDLLSGTQRHGQLGVFSVPSLPRHGQVTKTLIIDDIFLHTSKSFFTAKQRCFKMKSLRTPQNWYINPTPPNLNINSRTLQYDIPYILKYMESIFSWYLI